MKKTVLFLMILIGGIGFPQELMFKGRILDASTDEAVPYSNLVVLHKRLGVSSDKDGKFELILKAISKGDSIKISSLGYESKVIPLDKIKFDSNNQIYLNGRSTGLEEVVVANTPTFYNQKVELGYTKEDHITFTSFFGDEVSTLIENPYNTMGKMKSLTLFLKKTKKADYTSKLNIKFYTYDPIEHRPGVEIHKRNLIIDPKNKKQKFNINLLEKNIVFPKNGICIGVEWINDKGIEPKLSYRLGPSLAYTRSSMKEKTWGNYRGKGWYLRTFKDGIHVNNALIQVEVLLQSGQEKINP